MTQAVVPDAHSLSAWVRYEASNRGGHVGFITHFTPGNGRYWLERRIPMYLSPHLAEASKDTSWGLSPTVEVL